VNQIPEPIQGKIAKDDYLILNYAAIPLTQYTSEALYLSYAMREVAIVSKKLANYVRNPSQLFKNILGYS